MASGSSGVHTMMAVGGMIKDMMKRDPAHSMGGKSMNMPNLRVFPPSGVKFAKGGMTGEYFQLPEADNAGMSDKDGVGERFDQVGGEHDEGLKVDCPNCGHQFASGGAVPFGGSGGPEEEMMEDEMPHSESNVSEQASSHQQNPDHMASMKRRASLAKAIKRHRGY